MTASTSAAERIRLSIVMPVLNESRGIDQILEALTPVRSEGIELVVVDGGSSDGTVERLGGRADRVIRSSPGRALQQNSGARVARGGVLLFLHADTRLPPTGVRHVLERLGGGSGWGRFDVRLTGRHPLLRVVERLISLRSRLSGIATGDQAIFVTRDLFFAVGGFPEIPLMEDVALSRKLLEQHGSPVCLPGPAVTSSRRWEERGILRTILLMWRLRLGFWLGEDPGRLAARYR
jgi:rSAM/selenodomain-associated transferase 2